MPLHPPLHSLLHAGIPPPVMTRWHWYSSRGKAPDKAPDGPPEGAAAQQAVRATSQMAPAICPAGARSREAAPRQPSRWEEDAGPAPDNSQPPPDCSNGGCLILAAIYSRGTCRPTTIDVPMFHFRVRNGTGWGHRAMTTRLRSRVLFAAVCLWVFAARLLSVCCSAGGRLTSAWRWWVE